MPRIVITAQHYHDVVLGEGWTAGLAALCAATGAESSSAVLFDPGLGVVSHAATGRSQDSVSELVESGHWRASAFIRAPRDAPPRIEVLPDPALLPTDPVAASMIRADLRRHLLLRFVARDGRLARITLARGDAAPAFEDKARRLLCQAAPGLIRAAECSIAMADRSGRATLAALDQAGVAALLLDIRGRVTAATAAARLDGTPLQHTAEGRLALPAAAETARLAEAIRQAACGLHPAPLTCAAGAPATLRLTPAAGGAGQGLASARGAVLLILQPRCPTAEPGPLATLSPAERALADLLAAGVPLAEAARQQGVTVKTARTYVERIHAKTGVQNRAGLVAMMLKAGASR